jgi:hypothetical protein
MFGPRGRAVGGKIGDLLERFQTGVGGLAGPTMTAKLDHSLDQLTLRILAKWHFSEACKPERLVRLPFKPI